MTLVELEKLHDQMVTMSSLTADIAFFLRKGLDDPTTIDEEWVSKFIEKMQFLNTASVDTLEAQIGAEATANIYHTIEGAQQ